MDHVYGVVSFALAELCDWSKNFVLRTRTNYSKCKPNFFLVNTRFNSSAWQHVVVAYENHYW